MWAQLVAFAAGVWLTAAAQVLGYGGPARPNDHIVGPLAATVALTAAFQVTRGVRGFEGIRGHWRSVASGVRLWVSGACVASRWPSGR